MILVGRWKKSPIKLSTNNHGSMTKGYRVIPGIVSLLEEDPWRNGSVKEKKTLKTVPVHLCTPPLYIKSVLTPSNILDP